MTDWNSDGKLDILAGDATYQKAKPVTRTPEETSRMGASQSPASQSTAKKPVNFSRKLFGSDRVKDKAEKKKIQEEYALLMASWQKTERNRPEMKTENPRLDLVFLSEN